MVAYVPRSNMRPSTVRNDGEHPVVRERLLCCDSPDVASFCTSALGLWCFPSPQCPERWLCTASATDLMTLLCPDPKVYYRGVAAKVESGVVSVNFPDYPVCGLALKGGGEASVSTGPANAGCCWPRQAGPPAGWLAPPVPATLAQGSPLEVYRLTDERLVRPGCALAGRRRKLQCQGGGRWPLSTQAPPPLPQWRGTVKDAAWRRNDDASWEPLSRVEVIGAPMGGCSTGG